MGKKLSEGLTYQKVETTKALEKLSELVQIIWPEVFTPVIGAAQVAYMLATYQSIEQIKREISDGVLYEIISLDEEAVGYLAYELQENQLFISKVYLLANYRGQRLSRQAFNRLEGIARQESKDKLHLHVNRYNARAIAVYQHYGFDIDKAVDTPLGDFILNDYWMTKTLSD
ncbi:hypothetical protein FACS1894192_02120 [Bacilli bacterium]|nr:hypothetical protein FACS1894192_02120 [Bacilli bacterium]